MAKHKRTYDTNKLTEPNYAINYWIIVDEPTLDSQCTSNWQYGDIPLQ